MLNAARHNQPARNLAIACLLLSTLLVYWPAQVFAGEPYTEINFASGEQRLFALRVEFPDFRQEFEDGDVERVLGEVDSYYRDVSYGKVSISWTISNWYQFPAGLNSMNIQTRAFDYNQMTEFKKRTLSLADANVDYSKYDFVAIVATGAIQAHASCNFEFRADGLSRIRLIVVNESHGWNTWTHELGHIFPTSYIPFNGCGLPDLYSSQAADMGLPPSLWIGPWDLMDSARNGLSAWSRIKLGWLDPEVAPLDSSVKTFEIRPLAEKSGIRAVKIPVESEVYYVVEYRTKVGVDRDIPSEGVLIYFAQDEVGNGEGTLKVVDANPNTRTFGDAPFLAGLKFEDVKNDVYIHVGLIANGYALVAVSAAPVPDSDNDGLVDYMELRLGTDPRKPDTDSDGIYDGPEYFQYGTNPLSADSDKDGLSDGDELLKHETNPLVADTDSDGLLDGEEVKIGTNPLSNDTDSDGLLDGTEAQLGTNPLSSDSDNDGIKDADELALTTSPVKADTDQDGLSDGDELSKKTNPLSWDSDRDLFPDGFDPSPLNNTIPVVFLILVLVVGGVGLMFARTRWKGVSKQLTALRASSPPSRKEAKYCYLCGAKQARSNTFCLNCGAEFGSACEFA